MFSKGNVQTALRLRVAHRCCNLAIIFPRLWRSKKWEAQSLLLPLSQYPSQLPSQDPPCPLSLSPPLVTVLGDLDQSLFQLTIAIPHLSRGTVSFISGMSMCSHPATKMNLTSQWSALSKLVPPTPSKNRSLSSQSYSPARMSGIRKINAVDTLPYNMPGEHKSHTYTNGFNTGDIRDCLEFADEDPEPHAWLGQDKTKGQSGVCPMYCFSAETLQEGELHLLWPSRDRELCSYCYREELKRREREAKVHRPG